MKDNIFIEITVTNSCNCNCKYCFEGSHCHDVANVEVRKRQLQLLTDACKKFDVNKFQWLTISFWGGEPFLDIDFMLQIVNATHGYDFVRYHCYSNGTLTDNVKAFFESVQDCNIVHRFHIQLSYDGEPHHTIKRHDNSKQIFSTAELLKSIGVQFTFKATLSYDMIKHLPKIWKSYEQLYEKFGDTVSYYPTLDTTQSDESDSTYADWREALLIVAKYEYEFIQNHHKALFGWFQTKSKRNCMLKNSIHLHDDGKAYICHGCAYKPDNKNLTIAEISNIDSIFELLSAEYQVLRMPDSCLKCCASHCQICHVANLSANDDPKKSWLDCRVNNERRCRYFKHFGYVASLLEYALAEKNIWRA